MKAVQSKIADLGISDDVDRDEAKFILEAVQFRYQRHL